MNKLNTSVVGFIMGCTALFGCGGPGSVSGTVSGIELTVADAIFSISRDDAGRALGLNLLLADKPGLCTTLKANRNAKDATGLLFGLMNIKRENDTLTELASDVGDYTVTSSLVDLAKAGRWGIGGFSKSDSNCTNTLTSAATMAKSGLISVTGVKAEANGTASGPMEPGCDC